MNKYRNIFSVENYLRLKITNMVSDIDVLVHTKQHEQSHYNVLIYYYISNN